MYKNKNEVLNSKFGQIRRRSIVERPVASTKNQFLSAKSNIGYQMERLQDEMAKGDKSQKVLNLRNQYTRSGTRVGTQHKRAWVGDYENLGKSTRGVSLRVSKKRKLGSLVEVAYLKMRLNKAGLDDFDPIEEYL